MDAQELYTQVIARARAAKQAMTETYDRLIYAAETGRAELARLACAQARGNLDLKSEAEFAAELGVCGKTLRKHRQELGLEHVRVAASSVMYTAAQRAAACAALSYPRKRKTP